MNAEALVKVKGGDVIQPMKFHPLSLKPMVLEMPQNQDYVEKENKILSTKCSVTSSPGEKIKEKFQSFRPEKSEDSIGDSGNTKGHDSDFSSGNRISLQNPVQNVRRKILQVRSKSS